MAMLCAVGVYTLWAVHLAQPEQSTSRAASCSVSTTLVNSCRPWLAAVVNKYPAPVGADKKSQALAHEQRIGRQLDALKVYHTAGQTLDSDDTYFTTRANTFLMLNWKPVGKWADANAGNGTANQSIDAMANSIKSVAPHTIFLTLWHEPENDVSTGATCTTLKGGAGSPTDYINMWHYVRQRFNADQVTNVVWAIDFMNYPTWDCLWSQLYPGDSYVDWILFNAYGNSGSPNWSDNVAHFYNQLSSQSNSSHNYLSKPWGIAEWDAVNMTSAQGITYYNEAQSVLESNAFPKLKIYTVFDSIGTGGTEDRVAYDVGGVYDPAKMAAYKAFANSSVFAGGVAPAPDTTPPDVSILSPANGSAVSGTVSLAASATDNVGVTKVAFLVDSVNVQTDADGSDGWSAQWSSVNVGNGTHTVKAVAYDAAGNTATALASIAVSNQGAPTIHSFTASPSTIAGGNTTTLQWSADNTSSCAIAPGGPANLTASTWTTGQLSQSTEFTLSCKNSAGVTASATTVVTVTINGQATPVQGGSGGDTIQSTTGQTIIDGQNTDRATRGSLLTLDPNTVNNPGEIGDIVRVEFYDNGHLVQTRTKPPFALDTSLLKPGKHQIVQRTYLRDGTTVTESRLITILPKPSKPHTVATLLTIFGSLVVMAVVGFIVRRFMAARRTLRAITTPNSLLYGDIDLHDSLPRNNSNDWPRRR